MTYSEQNDALRARSGYVTDSRPLVSFIYVLLRDHLPAGEMEELVRESEKISLSGPDVFTNGFLALYAKDITNRLLSK